MLAFCSLLATFYFVHHAVDGRYGLEARARFAERSEVLNRQIASLDTVRRRLAADIAALSPGGIPHPDIVEEIAIDVLGFARPHDRWIAHPTRPQ